MIAAALVLACSSAGDAGTADTSQTTTAGGTEATPGPTTGVASAEATSAPPDGDDDSDESGEEQYNCGLQRIMTEVTIPRVMLVLDKSGSMVAEGHGYWDADADDADDDGFVDGDPTMTAATPRVSRWQSLHETVDRVVGDLEPRVDFGAVLFPSTDAEPVYTAAACTMNASPEVAIGPDRYAEILAKIPPAASTKLAGGTPATAGVQTAVAGLASDDLEDPDRPRYIVLVTDGAANCPLMPADDDPSSLFEHYDESFPLAIGDALAAGISTFVIGIDIEDAASEITEDGEPDDTNTYQRLNEAALAGGQARDDAEKFYNARNQPELQTALRQIAAIVGPCNFGLTYKPSLQWIEALVVDARGPSPLVYGHDQVADCTAESGWRFTDEEKVEIELCGDACSLYRHTGDVEITYQCWE